MYDLHLAMCPNYTLINKGKDIRTRIFYALRRKKLQPAFITLSSYTIEINWQICIRKRTKVKCTQI